MYRVFVSFNKEPEVVGCIGHFSCKGPSRSFRGAPRAIGVFGILGHGPGGFRPCKMSH